MARIESWLLLEYPHVWRRNAIPESGLPQALRTSLDRIARRFPAHRQLLIRRQHRASSPVRCFIAETREDRSRLTCFEADSYDDLARLDLAALPAGTPVIQPLYLVCTHGTHDKCCAKLGLPVYAALREHAGESVWQCTHVGGDRFAANLVCLPQGIYYGRVDPRDAPAIADAFARGEIWLGNYRGRCCYPRAAQVAEYFLRVETGIRRIDDLRLRGIERPAEGEWRVRFAATEQEYVVEYRTTPEALRQQLTCKSEEVSSIRQYQLVSCRAVR